MSKKYLTPFLILFVLAFSTLTRAEIPWVDDGNTRYLALGDSIAAGYGAIPVTQGYPYLLYRGGVFDSISNTYFANTAVPGATSADVLNHQVPLAIEAFPPSVITLTVGGNDVLSILAGADPGTVLSGFAANLGTIFATLRYELPDTDIYISNLYAIHDIPGIPDALVDSVIGGINNIIAGYAAAYNVPVADVFGEFDGQSGLLLIERHNAGLNVHPTNAGYRVIAQAFEDVIVVD
jgi:lysophospholipase L1-like esterase